MHSRDDIIRGVNLGGWLVLEKWMTPSLFAGTDAVDEYTFMQTAGARAKIKHHRRTFITEADFAWLASHNINTIRIPIGYWIFDGDAPYVAGIGQLDWAIKMATKYHLKVLIDLHGAKGSQSGRDPSGRIGKAEWHTHPEYRQQTIDILVRIAQRYRTQPAVWGIELLNEPKLGLVQWRLRKFYRQAYHALVQVARPGTRIVYHDAFIPMLMAQAIREVPSHPVVMDTHWYQFGTVFIHIEPLSWYYRRLRWRTWVFSQLSRLQPMIVGEWSVTLSGRILAGRDASAERKAFAQHSARQIKAFESSTTGWFYWSYKTEEQGIWHFRSQVEDGIIRLP